MSTGKLGMTTTHTIELRDVVKVYGSGPAGVRGWTGSATRTRPGAPWR